MKRTRLIIFMALFISMDIVLRRLLSYQTPIVRIDFGFVPIAAAMMFGPWVSGITAVMADLLGMLLLPKGPYFPGFTLSAFAAGAIYGLYLYKKQGTLLQITLASLTVTLLVEVGLQTLWLSILTGNAAVVIVSQRLIKAAFILPAQIVVIKLLYRYMGSVLRPVDLKRI